PADFAEGVLNLAWFEMFATTLVTFIPTGLLAAVRTGSFDIPVREEPPAFRTIRLMNNLLIDIPVFFQSPHDLLGSVMINRVISHAKIIEINPDSFKRFIKMPVELFGKCPGRNSPLFCRHDNWGPVIV